jgi:hypothetical protein
MGDGYGADWKFYRFNDLAESYYDVQSITRPSKNVVRVWERMNFTEKGIMDEVESLGKTFKKLEYSVVLHEINCAEKTVRMLSSTDYDNKGRVIFSDSSPTKWLFIIPGSIGESLYKEICK